MEKNRSSKPWSERLVKSAGAAMRRARKAKGGTAEWLSAEVARIGDGMSLAPNTIAKIDSGHRGSMLTVAELLVLAAALDVPPALLLFPGYPDGPVELLPGLTVTSREAVEWFSGQARLPRSGDEPANVGVQLVAAVREHASEGARLLDVTRLVQPMGLPDSTVQRIRQDVLDQMLDVANRIGELKKQLEGEN